MAHSHEGCNCNSNSTALSNGPQWRTDPSDGKKCTLDELEAKYEGMYTKVQIHKYWQADCLPCDPLNTKTVLMVRHGEAQHNVKRKKRVEFDAELGPALTLLGKTQAEHAARTVATALQTIVAREHGDFEGPMIVASNLFRAVETAYHVGAQANEIVVQPSLRERLAEKCDEPSELDALRRWADGACGPHLCLDAYEEAVALEGGSHAAYVEKCWAADCLPRADGCGWSDKANKEGLRARASQVTTWLEAQRASIIVVVGHSAFTPRITGDNDYMENCEVRRYSLCNGSWARTQVTTCKMQLSYSMQGAVAGRGEKRTYDTFEKLDDSVNDDHDSGVSANAPDKFRSWRPSYDRRDVSDLARGQALQSTVKPAMTSIIPRWCQPIPCSRAPMWGAPQQYPSLADTPRITPSTAANEFCMHPWRGDVSLLNASSSSPLPSEMNRPICGSAVNQSAQDISALGCSEVIAEE